MVHPPVSIKPALILLRPQQWVKNLFVFLPLFFGGHILDVPMWLDACRVFFCFCFVCSGIYCLNDIIDIDADRQHPHKRNRPVASGQVSVKKAILLMTACFAVGFILLFIGSTNWICIAVVASYALIQIAYCTSLKNHSIVDIICIALGFVARVVAGGVCTGIWVSHWIVMLTFMLTLLLAASKRRYDIILHDSNGTPSRKNINQYSVEYLNIIIGIIASVTIVCYVMYTVSIDVMNRTGSNYVYVTALFVIAGIFRYIQKTVLQVDEGSDPTHVLLHDRFIQINLLLWIICFAIIIYV